MTREKREKHLDWLCRLKSEIFVFMPQHWIIPFADALDVAIRELAQEPCEDAISRQAVLEQTYLWSKDEFLRVTNPFDYLRKRINSLPSIIPQYTDAEIQKMQEMEQAEIQKAYELGKENNIKILEKIRAEIEFEVDHRNNMLCAEDVFEIIDKYMAEGENYE